MLDKETERLMREEAKFFGINQGLRIYSPLPYSGVNQQSSRQGIANEEFFWVENYISIGSTNLRTLWDKGTPIYTAPSGKTIIYFYAFNIGANNYHAVFLNDGTAYAINTATLAQTTISSNANTFYNSSLSTQKPVCSQWGSSYLLIANNFSVNNYWVWDGTDLHGSGTLSPITELTSAGSGYTSAPSVVAYGGEGSGATFVATILNGSVTNIQVTDPGTGYEPGDIVQLYVSGGGTDNGVQLTAVLSAGAVSSVIITDPGSGYTAGTYALGISVGGGTGAAGTYTVNANGNVASTIITNGGSGYTGTPTISFPSGSGSGADGIANITAGTVASVTVVHGGSNFIGTPTLTFDGGNGTGATATAVLTSGVITSVTVTAGGNGYTSTPAVIIETGLNNAASATVTLMPFGVSGTAMETYDSRVWITYPNQSVSGNGVQQNGSVMYVSAPESFTDFATSDGGNIFTSSDSFLRAQYTNLKQSNGYLYPIGDSSVSVISNVQSVGSPISTTFNYQNTDPQIGSSWRDSVSAYSTTILFANQFGVYGIYGGQATKISAKMDNIFNNAVFPAAGGVTPSSAIANLFAQKAYLLLMTIQDPFTFQSRNVLLGWDQKQWFIASQSNLNLTFIGTQEINSNCIAYGTDGNALYPLFNAPSTALTKTISTKLYGQENFLIQKQSMGVYLQVQDLSANATGVSFSSVSVDSETGSYPIENLPVVATPCPPPYYSTISTGASDTFGVNLGCTLVSNSADYSISMIGVSYIETGSIALASTPIAGDEPTL